MKYLFLDTNILIHYQSFEDIPWKSVLQITDEITIVICETVVAEIDKHKDGQKSRIRDRAKKVSSRISELLLEDKVGKLPVVFCPFVKPSEDEERIYDTCVCDNRIILSALHSSYLRKDIIVVSADNNLLIKAKSAGLKFHKMKEDFLVKGEPTEEEKELKKAKEELAKWVNRLPDPHVIFFNVEGDTIEFPIAKLPDIDAEVENRIQKEEQRYPKKEESIRECSHENPYGFDSFFQPTREKIITYNTMRVDYLKAYREKVCLEVKKEFAEASFKKLQFYLANNGTAPTGKMFITLRFQAGTKLYTEADSKTTQEYPPLKTPQFVNTIAQCFSGNYYSSHAISYIDEMKPISKKQFQYEKSELIHGLQSRLETELMINTSYAQDIIIEWIINDSSLIECKTGTLKIIVK